MLDWTYILAGASGAAGYALAGRLLAYWEGRHERQSRKRIQQRRAARRAQASGEVTETDK